ncbi:MAG: PA0069 family radical SAM protein [Gammaproteobacteria bacterium]|nr:PA0069 family radical SAM protein [Gammaproteobacteria bacterium]
MADQPIAKIKGRGTASKIDGRYLDWRREDVDDGWGDTEPPAPIRTTVTVEHPRTIISRNDSPDIPFEASINPYRGCEHGCVYCLSGETLILMEDASTRALADIQVGDLVYGTQRNGWYRRYVKSVVKAHWSVVKPAYRITLADGTSLVAGPDHRFLTERGWKFVIGAEQGHARRPHLTTNNKLMGTGAFAHAVTKDPNYRLGYLCGMIRADVHLGSYHYQRAGRANGDQHRFRLALIDREALERTRMYLGECDIATKEFVFQKAAGDRKAMQAIRTSARAQVERIGKLISWPSNESPEWHAGFLAGIFDAEGSFSQCNLRILNTDMEIIDWVCRGLQALGFRYCVEHRSFETRKSMNAVRLLGGLPEQLRFLHTMDPAITRKRNIEGQAVKTNARLEVIGIESLGKALRLYDMTTETGDFIANGVVSHNCYARPTHAYLDLSPGIDFESKLFAKPDAAKLLRQELAKPGYRCTPIALGTNTDPYQPIEREWRITRGIIEVLHETDHPLTIVTKSWLVERDIDLLAPMAEKGLVQVALSITSLRNDLARKMEPRASSPKRRVETLRRLSDAGIPAGVMFAPVIPFINDAEMEAVLEHASAAGARWAGYVIVRLPLEIKELFSGWLKEHEPLKAGRVLNAIRDLRGGRLNDPEFHQRMKGSGQFADLIRQRFRHACDRLGLNGEEKTLRTELFRPPSGSDPQLEMF